LKNYPRDLQEFQSGKDLYGENFADAGFVEVGLNDLQVGDVLMMSIMSNKINHAALYLGGNEIIHHQINRFSCSDRLDKWERFIVKVVRYAKNN
jgi:cell wall-associated NlpC family hydrolase